MAALLAAPCTALAQGTDPFGGPLACVVCSEPSALYRCRVGEADAIKGSERAVQFVCITELARLGGHASCRVRRDLVGGCDAPERVVSLKGYSGTDASAPSPGPTAPAGADPASASPPQTLEELARQTAASSGTQLKKAGDAVTGTARSAGSAIQSTGQAVGDVIGKSWTCMTSLFQRCGGDDGARRAPASAPSPSPPGLPPPKEPPAGNAPAYQPSTPQSPPR